MIKIEEVIDIQDKALESYSIEEITELLQKNVFGRVDKALYSSKENGRNRVTLL